MSVPVAGWISDQTRTATGWQARSGVAENLVRIWEQYACYATADMAAIHSLMRMPSGKNGAVVRCLSPREDRTGSPRRSTETTDPGHP